MRDRRPHSLKTNRSGTAIPSTDLFAIMETPMMLYKLTMATTGHGHKPTRQIVAPDIETAIRAVRETLDKHERDAPVRWVETITHVDLVANKHITDSCK